MVPDAHLTRNNYAIILGEIEAGGRSAEGRMVLALEHIRRLRGLSQRELAEKAGVSPATVYELEVGKRPMPRPSTLRKLAGALDVEIADLYGEPIFAGKVEPPSRGLGRSWASDKEYEDVVEMVNKMHRNRYSQLHGLRLTSSNEERRELLSDVVAAYSALKAVGVSVEERPVGFWMQVAMVQAFGRLADASRTARETHGKPDGEGIPVISFEEARERLRAA